MVLHTNLIICSVIFLNAIGHMESDIPVGKIPLRETIWKYTLLFSTGINILDRVIWEMDLFGPIRVVLFTLFTVHKYNVYVSSCLFWSKLATYLGNSMTSSPSG